MKVLKLFALLAIVILGASAAKADTIDPTVIIRQVDPAPIPVTDPNQTFSFTATAGVSDVAFQNDTGVLLQQLSLALTGTDALGNPLSFSFGPNPGDGIFANFLSTVDGNTTTLLFFGVDATHTGLVPGSCTGGGELSVLTFCTPGGIYDIQFSGIPVGGIVNGTATVSPIATPEPTTLILFSAGLAGIAAFRKRRSSPQA